MFTRRLIVFVCNFVVALVVWATEPIEPNSQGTIFELQRLGLEDGLPARMTYFMVQDVDGFIWVSTQIGIHRYDGYRFSTIRNPLLGLSERNPARLALDCDNRLWYCRGSGGVLDTNRETLLSVDSLSKGRFGKEDLYQVINPDRNSKELVVVTYSGSFYKYNGSWEKIGQISLLEKENISIQKTEKGKYWVSIGNRFISLENGKQSESYDFDFDYPEYVNWICLDGEKPILEFNKIKQNQFWTVEDGNLLPYPLEFAKGRTVKSLLYLDANYIFWQTEDSLMVSDRLGKLLFAKNSMDQMNYRKMLTVNTTIKDRKNNYWVASDDGIFKLTVNRSPFTVFGEGHGTWGIMKTKDKLWLGGHKMPWLKKMETEIKFKKPKPISFFQDGPGHVWIGTQANLIVEYISNHDSLTYHWLPTGIQGSQIYKNPLTGHFWIGGRNGGYILDETLGGSERFQIGLHLFPNIDGKVIVQKFIACPEGIFALTNKGLFLYDASTEELIEHYNEATGFPFENLIHLYRDQEGIFWIGTRGGGLIRWDRAQQTFRRFTIENGLSNNMIYAVYEDDYGYLWLPSDYGLMAFDKKSHMTKTYLPRNGIAHEEFNTNSHFRDSDGTLYFGGLGGVTKFHPSDVHGGTASDAILFVNRVRSLEEGNGTLTDRTPAFRESGQLQIHPHERILEVDLSLMDLEDPTKNLFAYKIPGHLDEWNYTNVPKISLFGLPYGDYKLMIKGRGASGNWSSHELKLPVQVLRPFYLKTWFLLTMLALTIALIWGAVRLRLRSLKMEKIRLEREVVNRTRTIAEQSEELKEMSKVKSRFFANITHEFRTPLTLVIGPVEQLISDNPKNKIIKELKGVLRNSRNLLRLVNQLLDISKLEHKHMDLEVAKGDLVAYTQGLIEQFQASAQQKQLGLSFNSSTDRWVTYFDADKWEKIIFNLVSNAIKFTPAEGTVLLSLRKVVQQDLELIQLEVKDTGMGIAEENQDLIFDRFYQVNNSFTRVHGGTGIGLSLVQELVRLQQGKISVTSQVGEGSTFLIQLPVLAWTENATPLDSLPASSFAFGGEEITTAPEVINERGAADNLEVLPPPEDLTDRLEILLVEDNAELRRYLRSCLDPERYQVTEAANGEEGLQKALKIVPDLIISDVMMPKMDGFRLAEAIRSHLATSHIPLILLTAKASLKSRLEGFRSGADAYLSKPFNPEELRLRLQKLIEIRQLLRQRYGTDKPLPESAEEDHSVFKQEDVFIADLTRFISQNIQDPSLKIDTISRHFGLSRTQLYRKIQSLTDKTISEIIRTERCEKAMELIKQGQYSVADISYQVGYSSPSYFSRAFKKHFGQSPRDILVQYQ